MAYKKPPAKKIPVSAYSTIAFASMVETQALTLKMESAPAFDFSTQTRAALDQAKQEPTLDNLGVACRLAAAELEGKAALGELVKTLSLAIALPTPGARGAANVIYPAFGTGLSASNEPSGRQANLMAFSSVAHLINGRRAPVETWSKVEEEAAPAAYWIEKNAIQSFEIAQIGSSDYLSARWLEMGAQMKREGGLADLSALVSEEALRESEKNAKSSERMLEFNAGRLALGKVMTAQRDLMSAMEGFEKGGGVFVAAVEAWSKRKRKEQADKEKRSEQDRGPLGNSVARLAEVGRVATELIAALPFGEPTVEEKKRLTRLGDWFATDLSGWLELPPTKGGSWSKESAQKFEEEAALEGFLADGIAALNEGAQRSSRSWDLFYNMIAASAYCCLRPPSIKGKEDSMALLFHELRNIEEALEDALHRVDLGEDAEDLVDETRWSVGSLIEDSLEEKRYAVLMPAAKANSPKRKAPASSEEQAAWEGIEELLALGDQCLLTAAGLARERELAALESMGLMASAELARSDQSGSATLLAMASKETRRRAAAHADALTRALSLHGQMFKEDQDGTALEYGARMHGARSGSKAEMEAFFQSPMGEVYAEALERLSEKGESEEDEPRALALYQACLQEFRDPSPGIHPLSERPMSDATGAALLNFLQSVEDKSEETDEQSQSETLTQWLNDLQGAGPSATWIRILGWLGNKEGLALLSDRSAETERQCPMAARWLVETALGLEPRDPAPRAKDDRPLKKGEGRFPSLPYGYEPDAKLRARGLSELGEAGDFEDAEVSNLLRSEGFAGEAALAAKICYGEIATREGADARSRANAWLAAGKRLCKEELGMTEGAYQAARGHEAAGKRLAGLLPKIVKAKLAQKERSLKQEDSSGLTSGPDQATGARRAMRLPNLFSAALSRSMDPSRAYVVAEAIEPGNASSGELDLTIHYLHRAFEPMSSGLSRSETLAALRREMKAREALFERFEGALLERADELLKATTKKTTSAAERSAIETLKGDLARVDDWAADNAGAFFTRLNPKVCWAHLRRGEQEWHEEVIVREASSEQGWDAALGNWSDPSGKWTAEELLSPEELAAEGKAMRHCVGSYSSYCRNGSTRIFSIKKNGVRALTAQFDSSSARSVSGRLELAPTQWSLNQNKGPCNAEPTKEGKAITKALQEALQASWGARLEEKIRKAIESVGEIEEPASLGAFEVPGFNPDKSLDLNKLRRPLKKAGPKKTAG